ncbi:hypothetical protein BP6252_10284 [Coleophoma cylindrospora]|uniref:Heterokaryon incompatibility domain-containing protein n=1 Tax=Coleophoma cylindrospora TaxID=1849047 RepID=A0A3D8QS31_9HELO|nr:hypothetical protein BP6252_10284 [Coleophoma cylindrospora]
MHLLSWEVLSGSEGRLKIRLERDTSVSKYAILSHRWGNPEDEVSFEDMLTGKEKGKKGYLKLIGCCKQAQQDGLRHVWIDTCCINKASSAELSEAITSMFTYYERSAVCYAFLDDVLLDASAQENLGSSSFARSAWFTRGWTLQELIAPKHVKFYNSSWGFLGYKIDEPIASVIESVTGVDSIVLNIPATTELISIAKKMSWAARRKTTRVEDMAYSLMGIFGVYMPPLYGEGYHAFIRLQEAIMRTSNDHTIFAWTSPPIAPLSRGFEHISTMLALSPDQFEFSSRFKPLAHSEHSKTLIPGGYKLDYAITNAGLAIRLPLLKIDEVEGLYAAFLACTESEDRVQSEDRIPSAILLRTTARTPAGHFWRTNSDEGPIERSTRHWFPISGREAIDVKDVYVLPRFTSVSGDNIEPVWSRVNIAKTQHKKGDNLFSRTRKLAFAINREVLNDLNHVPDPSFRELAFLRQAYQMISTNQADQLVSMTRIRQRFPKTIPLPRNKRFYGRAAVLQKLRDAFFPPERDDKSHRSQGRSTASYTISGIGGIGKTQVAAEFGYDCIENDLFDAVFWIGAESTKAVHEGFQRIASELELPEHRSSTEIIVREVLRWLSDFDQYSNILSSGGRARSAKWLLVFDDVEDVTLLQSFWPSTGPGCVLVTSRDPNSWYTLGSENIALEPFTVQESSEMLTNLTRKQWDFAGVSKLLGGHPLAIEQTARMIVTNGLSLEEFHRRWDETQTKLLDDLRYSNQSSKYSLTTAWSAAFRQLTPASRGLLQVISFLNPDFIQDTILIPSQTVALKELPQNEPDLLQSRSDLLRYALVSRSPEGDGLQVHSLIQALMRGEMDPDVFQKALATAVALVSFAWNHTDSTDPGQPLNPKIRKDLVPHVMVLKDFATEMMDSEVDFGTSTTYSQLLSSVTEHGSPQ